MEWVIAVIVVVVIGLAAAMATGALGEMRDGPVRDHYRRPLPVGTMSGTDVHELRFGVTLRGYSMAQVDEVIDRLSAEIGERDRLLGDRYAREHEGLYRDEVAPDDAPADHRAESVTEVDDHQADDHEVDDSATEVSATEDHPESPEELRG